MSQFQPRDISILVQSPRRNCWILALLSATKWDTIIIRKVFFKYFPSFCQKTIVSIRLRSLVRNNSGRLFTDVWWRGRREVSSAAGELKRLLLEHVCLAAAPGGISGQQPRQQIHLASAASLQQNTARPPLLLPQYYADYNPVCPHSRRSSVPNVISNVWHSSMFSAKWFCK